MTAYRTALALAASTFALVGVQAAFAQDVPAQTITDPSADPAPAAAPDTQDDIIVTGTRAVGRSRLDSASPVDVLSSAAIQRQGTTELGAALAAIADGTIDVLCSGHEPRGPEEKRLPFTDSSSGMAGAETLLPLALMLVRDEHLTLERLFALLARNPARVLGLDTGTLEVGKPADLMLFDGQAPWQIVGEAFKAEAGNTPFDGLPVQGRVLRLWKGGREVR